MNEVEVKCWAAELVARSWAQTGNDRGAFALPVRVVRSREDADALVAASDVLFQWVWHGHSASGQVHLEKVGAGGEHHSSGRGIDGLALAEDAGSRDVAGSDERGRALALGHGKELVHVTISVGGLDNPSVGVRGRVRNDPVPSAA